MAPFSDLVDHGAVRSFVTSIYTFRAYFRTFLGTERLPEEAGHHAHEASSVMLAPLYVLAAGSVGIGLALFLTDSLNHFVLPIPFLAEAHEHPHENIWLVVISIGLVLGGAAVRHGRRSGVQHRRSRRPRTSLNRSKDLLFWEPTASTSTSSSTTPWFCRSRRFQKFSLIWIHKVSTD